MFGQWAFVASAVAAGIGRHREEQKKPPESDVIDVEARVIDDVPALPAPETKGEDHV